LKYVETPHEEAKESVFRREFLPEAQFNAKFCSVGARLTNSDSNGSLDNASEPWHAANGLRPQLNL